MNQPIVLKDQYLLSLVYQLIHQLMLLFLKILNVLIQQGQHLLNEVLKHIYVTFQFLILLLLSVYLHEINLKYAK